MTNNNNNNNNKNLSSILIEVYFSFCCISFRQFRLSKTENSFFPIDKLSYFNRTASSGLREKVFHIIFIQLLFFIIKFSISTDVLCL